MRNREKVSLEIISSVALVARQLGAVISNEQVSDAFKGGYCNDRSSATDYFNNFGISIFFKKLKKQDIIKKKFLYPCVVINQDGQAFVLISSKTDLVKENQSFQVIDVFASTLGTQTITAGEFFAKWTGYVVLVGRRSENVSQDRLFDVDWLVPEFVRFKWLFLMAFIMSLLLHLIAFAPIIFFK